MKGMKMSEKAKLIKKSHEVSRYVDEYKCEKCGIYFRSRIFYIWKDGFTPPNYCPFCGAEFIQLKSPSEITEEIKRIYHQENQNVISSPEEARMEALLDELKNLAEANETKQK